MPETTPSVTSPLIHWDSQVGGFTCFKGDLKLAVYFTHSDRGLYRNGVVIHEQEPPGHHTLHFTSPQMRVEDVRAVLDTLPDPASHPHNLRK